MAKVTDGIKNLPTRILSQDEIVEIVDSFRKGDFTLSEKFILYHSRVAISSALRMRKDTEAMLSEMVSEALFQLCLIPQEVHEGKLLDYGLTQFTISRVKTRCLNFMRNDRVFKIPAMSSWRTGKRVKKLSNPIPRFGFSLDSENFMFSYSCRNFALIYGLVDSSVAPSEEARRLYADIMSCVRTEGERIVIKLRSEERTDKEIAHILGTSVTHVVNKRKDVESRYIQLCKRRKDAEFLNTFLPYPDYTLSAQVLDNKRLGKQRVEVKQILLGQFPNHPCCKMWKGHEYSLCEYGQAVCAEWTGRGFEDSIGHWLLDFKSKLTDTGPPLWLGKESIHNSHQSNLLRKDPVYYGTFGWKVPDYLPYDWNS